MRLCGTLAAVTLLALAKPAHAGPAAQTFALVYDVPAGCPARATFVASIRARAPGSRETAEAAELDFDVHVTDVGELTRGVLSVRFAHGERFEREVPAASCADVTTSMAIMAGLLLSGALLPEPATTAVPATLPATPELPSPAPANVIERPVSVPAAPSVSAAASRSTGATQREKSLGRLQPGAFAHGVLELGGLPFPAFGVDAGLDLALERPSTLAPSLRAGFSYRAGRASSSVGDGSFVLRALLLRGCPARIALGTSVFFHPCALFDAGRLSVSGRSTTNPADRHMPWLALGGAGRLELRLGAIAALEAELSVYGLSHHDRFVLEPGSVELYDIPAISGEAALGFVARLP